MCLSNVKIFHGFFNGQWLFAKEDGDQDALVGGFDGDFPIPAVAGVADAVVVHVTAHFNVEVFFYLSDEGHGDACDADLGEVGEGKAPFHTFRRQPVVGGVLSV